MAALQDNYDCYMMIEKQEGSEKAQEFLMSLPYSQMRYLSEKLIWEKPDFIFANLKKAFDTLVGMEGQNG